MNKENSPIYVTQPSLAPLEEYMELLKGVWARGILTHNGPLVQQLEQEICEKVGLNKFIAVSNGTIACKWLLRLLSLKAK